MKNTIQVEQPAVNVLQESLHRLIAMLTEKSLWNFLSDKERQVVSEVISKGLAK